MKPVVIAVLLALALGLGPSAIAGPGPQMSLAPMPAISSQIPEATPVQWRCRRDCDRCRHYCDASYGDRRAFTLCMRDCWERVCRWC